jgi:hypothetical protein
MKLRRYNEFRSLTDISREMKDSDYDKSEDSEEEAEIALQISNLLKEYEYKFGKPRLDWILSTIQK